MLLLFVAGAVWSQYPWDMGDTPGSDALGRKVFILNPPSVFEEELLHEVLKNEYEIYLLRDTGAALRVFAKYPDSIVFINIDSGPKEEQWETYIRRLMTDSKYEGIKIGILSYGPSPELMQKYLMDVGIQCGFVRLSLGAQESAKVIIRVLEANEAKGRRKYVRARCDKAPNTDFNLEYAGEKMTRSILDISSVGAAVLGSRDDDPQVHVLLFRGESAEKEKSQIRHLIHRSLQAAIERI